MKIQRDSFEERSESPDLPDLPEPLYEEVGDFGLQVLKSLQTSFLSGGTAETREVLDQPPLRPTLWHTTVQEAVQTETPEQSGNGGAVEANDLLQLEARRRSHLHGVCTPSQELLLQELSSAFSKNPEEDQEDQRDQENREDWNDRQDQENKRDQEDQEVNKEEERPYDV